MLRSRLNVNVFVYEYSGYSHSEYIKPNKPSVAVKPSEDNLYADIEAAYQYLTNQHIHPRNIIVFGRSLGSGPSCHLAARHNVGGLVLISALTSILRVPLPWLRITIPGDMFVCRSFRSTCPTKPTALLTVQPNFIVHISQRSISTK